MTEERLIERFAGSLLARGHPLPAAVGQDHAHARPDGDDRERFCAPAKEAGRLAEYPHELTVFPKGKHDDQVDSTAEMLDWFKRGGQGPQDWPWPLYNWNAGLLSFPRKQESRGFK